MINDLLRCKTPFTYLTYRADGWIFADRTNTQILQFNHQGSCSSCWRITCTQADIRKGICQKNSSLKKKHNLPSSTVKRVAVYLPSLTKGDSLSMGLLTLIVTVSWCTLSQPAGSLPTLYLRGSKYRPFHKM